MAKESEAMKKRKAEWLTLGLALGLTLVASVIYAFITIKLFVLGLVYAERFDETEKSLLIMSGTMGIVILVLLFRDMMYYYNRVKEIEKK